MTVYLPCDTTPCFLDLKPNSAFFFNTDTVHFALSNSVRLEKAVQKEAVNKPVGQNTNGNEGVWGDSRGVGDRGDGRGVQCSLNCTASNP